MRSIIFFSTAVQLMNEEELTALGKECADFDSHVGITGMLLHRQGNFLQVIEGSKAVIRDMFARINADPRHRDVQVISDRRIARREFDGQAVGFVNMDALPPDTPFLNPFAAEVFTAEPELALLALSYFFRNSKHSSKTK
jgi:hypothetical protein